MLHTMGLTGFARALLLAPALVLLAGCGGGGGGASGSGLGAISVIADFQSPTRVVPGYADSLRVTVTPPPGLTLPAGMANPFILTRASATRSLAELPISAQPYQLAMEALTDNTVVATAQRSVVVTSGTVREVDVSANLQASATAVVVDGVSSLAAGQTSQFTAHVVDANNATLFSGAGFSFTSSSPAVLAVDQNTGAAQAALLGDATVTATLKGTVLVGTKNVSVGSSGNVTVQISPPSATVTPGGQAQFTATVTGAGNQGVAWSVTPLSTSGVVSNTGTYTAPMSDGLYFVQATSLADPTVKAEAVVSVAGPGSSGRIVFESYFDNNPNIWMTDLTASTYWRLTDTPQDERHPAMSPNGARISYTRWAGQDNLYAKNLSTGVETQLTNTAPVEGACWGPDGQQVYFQVDLPGSIEIHRVNADGTGEVTIINSAGHDGAPSVSPDGSRIAFWSSRTGQNLWYIANADGSNQVPIAVPCDVTNQVPASWSVDGAKLMLRGPGGLVSIVNTSNFGTLDSFTVPFASPSGMFFSPDGSSLIVSAPAVFNDSEQLFAFSIPDRTVHRISDRSGGLVYAARGVAP
jgi:hypothetical protein